VELTLAIVGIIGTLSAGVLTHLLAGRAETRRSQRDDDTRWLTERRRISAELLAGALRLERHLWSACAQLDRDRREERLPGHVSILLTPVAGVPPVLDRVTRQILVEAIEEAFEALEPLEVLVAEVELMAAPGEAPLAQNLLESLADVVGLLETFSPFDEAADAVQEARAARESYLDAARAGLRIAERPGTSGRG
jgi:hypothetical protein